MIFSFTKSLLQNAKKIAGGQSFLFPNQVNHSFGKQFVTHTGLFYRWSVLPKKPKFEVGLLLFRGVLQYVNVNVGQFGLLLLITGNSLKNILTQIHSTNHPKLSIFFTNN